MFRGTDATVGKITVDTSWFSLSNGGTYRITNYPDGESTEIK